MSLELNWFRLMEPFFYCTVSYSGTKGGLPICASACALIWVAGRAKLIHGNGRVGFHAAYFNDGSMSVSAPGNALVGAFLARIGISDMAIVYFTETRPQDIKWLTKSDSQFLGLDVSWRPPELETATAPKEDFECGLCKLIGKPKVDSEPLVGADVVRKALLKQRLMALLSGRYPDTFESIVRDVTLSQKRGLSWTQAVFRSYTTVKLPEKLERDMLRTMFTRYSGDLLNLLIVQVLERSAKTSPELCAKLISGNELEAHVSKLIEDGPEWFRRRLLSLFDKSLEVALTEPVAPLKPVSKRELKELNRFGERAAQDFLKTLTPNQRRRFGKFGKGSSSDLHCKAMLYVVRKLAGSERYSQLIMDVKEETLPKSISELSKKL